MLCTDRYTNYLLQYEYLTILQGLIIEADRSPKKGCRSNTQTSLLQLGVVNGLRGTALLRAGTIPQRVSPIPLVLYCMHLCTVPYPESLGRCSVSVAIGYLFFPADCQGDVWGTWSAASFRGASRCCVSSCETRPPVMAAAASSSPHELSSLDSFRLLVQCCPYSRRQELDSWLPHRKGKLNGPCGRKERRC